MTTNTIILWEYQKKMACEVYECSDEQGRIYPDCKNDYLLLGICPLRKLQEIIKHLNKPCEHPKTICVNEEGAAGVFCSDCHEQLEKEC